MRRAGVVVCMAAALIALVVPLLEPLSPLLLYNTSDSAPRGWYLRRPLRSPAARMRVLAQLPPAAARLADRRGYLPAGLPVLKRVAAVSGQAVCLRGRWIWINGEPAAGVLIKDALQRPLTPWPGCRLLGPHEVFLLGIDSPASFDSRYFGPLDRSAILGEALPLWTR